jgi:hypothetical protein
MSPFGDFARECAAEFGRIWRRYSWPMRILWLAIWLLLAYGVVRFVVIGADY